jgi:CBS-domain-containing membrane protein
MNAAEVMSRNVVTIRQDATLRDAIRLMLDHAISGLPVVDAEGRVVGMVTEGDLLRRAETQTERHRPRWLEILMGPGRLSDEYVRSHARKVGEIMTQAVVGVPPDAPLDQIVALMEQHRVKRLPVLDGERLVGIVSRADLLRALARLLDREPAAAGDDAAIRQSVLAEMARGEWAPRVGISVTVTDGVVDLRGVITDDKERAALRVAAENVPGVRVVTDHLVWVEPLSGVVIGPGGEPD